MTILPLMVVVTLLSAATSGDVLELVAYKAFNVETEELVSVLLVRTLVLQID